MAKAAQSSTKAKGLQEVRAGNDCGGHAAYAKAEGPASSKQGSTEKTPYKHR